MFQLLAVCPMGLEAVVAKEIQELGYETQVENGRIFLKVMLKLLCNAIPVQLVYVMSTTVQNMAYRNIMN